MDLRFGTFLDTNEQILMSEIKCSHADYIKWKIEIYNLFLVINLFVYKKLEDILYYL